MELFRKVSGDRTVGFCADEVLDQLAKERSDIVESVALEGKPGREGALEARERVTPVNQVVRTGVGVEGFAGSMDGQSVQVVGEDFGAVSGGQEVPIVGCEA